MAKSSFDDTNLQRMISELDRKHHVKALKGALRIAGNTVKKTAVRKLQGSVHSSKGLEKGIKVKVWKRKAGFSVSISRGYYKSKRFTGTFAREVPVLLWLEAGTKVRRTKKKLRFSRGGRKSHSTGQLRSYGFMTATAMLEKTNVTDNLHEAINTSVTRITKKYGCK